jgi:hypothetical protein
MEFPQLTTELFVSGASTFCNEWNISFFADKLEVKIDVIQFRKATTK